MGLAAGPVYAHGFGERYDLPIPLDYFLAGAAGAVALSFVVVGLFVRRRPGPFGYPRIDLLAVPWLGRALGSPLLLWPIRLLSVAVFGIIVATALFGVNRPIENLAPTVVWILWWVGMGYVSALLGNVWMLINPWKITFEWAQALIGGDGDEGRRAGCVRLPGGAGRLARSRHLPRLRLAGERIPGRGAAAEAGDTRGPLLARDLGRHGRLSASTSG